MNQSFERGVNHLRNTTRKSEWTVFDSVANNHSDTAPLKRTQIANRSNLDYNTVRTAVDTLLELDLIEAEGSGRGMTVKLSDVGCLVHAQLRTEMASDSKKTTSYVDGMGKTTEHQNLLQQNILTLEAPQLPRNPERWAPLLHPTNELIPLQGRADLIKTLENWLHDDTLFSWRVLTGPAGQGKTRLATHMLRRAHEDNWDAGFVTKHGIKLLLGERMADWSPSKDLFIAIDYAASRQDRNNNLLRELLSFLHNACSNSERSPRIRLLLLERTAALDEGWLPELLVGHEGLLGMEIQGDFAGFDELGATAVQERPEFIQEVINATVEAWNNLDGSKSFSLKPLSSDEIVRIGHATQANPLYLQMAALAACSAGNQEILMSLSQADLLREAAQRELKHIDTHSALRGESPDTRKLIIKAMAGITLLGGKPFDDPPFRNFIESERPKDKRDIAGTGDILDYLAMMMGAQEHDGITCLRPMEPDVIGSAFIDKALSDWHSSAAEAIQGLTEIDGGTVLARLAMTAHDCLPLEGTDKRIGWLHLALERARLQDLLAAQETMIEQQQLLWQGSVSLDGFLAALQERTVTLMQGEPVDDRSRALALTMLGWRRARMGQPMQGMEPSEQGLSMLKTLAESDDGMRLEHAHALANHAAILEQTGQLNLAEKHMEGAMHQAKRLFQDESDWLFPFFTVMALAHAQLLGKAGRFEDALKSLDKPLLDLKELAKKDSENFTTHYAEAMNLKSMMLARIGVQEEAERVVGESVKIHRELAEQNRDHYLPGLALALNNLANRLTEMGKHSAGLDAAEEAVAVLAELRDRNPYHAPAYASSLFTLAKCRVNLGRNGKAEKAMKASVSLMQDLSEQNPEAHEAGLARSLGGAGSLWRTLGRYEEAASATERAVQLWQRLSKSQPLLHAVDLARALMNHSNSLEVLSRTTEAADTARAGIRMFEKLMDERPAAHREEYIDALSRRARTLEVSGHSHEAIQSAKRAAEESERLLRDVGPRCLPLRARCLTSSGKALLSADDHPRAIAVLDQALLAYSQLEKIDLPSHRGAILETHLAQSGSLVSAGQTAEAIRCLDEASQTIEGLRTEDPALYKHMQSRWLMTRANALQATGNFKEAIGDAHLAVSLRRELAEAAPGSHLSDLAVALSKYAGILWNSGDSERSMEISGELLRLRERIDQDYPGVTSNLNETLTTISDNLSKLRKFHEAEEMNKRAIKGYRAIANQSDVACKNLATALNNQAIYAYAQGKRNEALLLVREAIDLLEERISRVPGLFEPAMAMALTNHAMFLRDAARLDEAARAAERSVDLYRKAVEQSPGDHRPELAASLGTYASIVAQRENLEGGIKANDECIAIKRALTAINPHRHMQDLAGSLHNQSVWLSMAKRSEEAKKASAEFLGLYQKIPERARWRLEELVWVHLQNRDGPAENDGEE